MKKNICIVSLFILALVSMPILASNHHSTKNPIRFVHIDGIDLRCPDGSKLNIKGTNLGNWLNPEGYMFGFKKTNSARMINDMYCELIGPDATAAFWKRFKDNYITLSDIRFIASTGSNTIRLPFHYKLFTDEDYMGLTSNQDGFARIDSLIKWCRDYHLYLILDMHDAPGGQTGDNIDDSYGYPWIYESQTSQLLFCSIWKKIAARYRNEPVILGYELLNEPIPHYMKNKEELNAKLEQLYKKGVQAIREVDKNHIILLGGSQWDTNFNLFHDWNYDANIMFTCHRYGGEASAAAIKSYINFRDKTKRPMYMGEIGHNSFTWMSAFVKVLSENNIGWTFWPYKKINGDSFVGFKGPQNWDTIIKFSESPRNTFAEIQANRPDWETSKKIIDELIEKIQFKQCKIDSVYIQAIGLKY